MRRRALLTGALLAALAGCGVPAETDVKVAGPGVPPAPAGGPDITRPLPARGDARTPQELVENFLAAAAGDPAGAEQRTREFFPAGEQGRWKPGNKVNVVRRDGELVVTQEGTSYQVDLPVRHVGVLDGGSGSLEGPTETTTLYRFRVVPGSDGSLFISGWDQRLQHLLLSTTALSTYYQPRNLYFWAGDGASLVPDLRYLPVSVDSKERPTHVVKWLLEGASTWLRPGVDEMPENVSLEGNVTSPDNRHLEVNLAAPDVGKDATLVDRLAAQLRWSLATDLVVLKIDGQEKKVGTAYQPLVADLPDTPERFALLNGQVRPLNTVGADPPAPSSVLDAADNSKVVRAALARQEDDYAAALVRRSGDRLRLWVGWRRSDGQVAFRQVGDATYATMSRPQWLPGQSGRAGVVLADGRLYRFDRNGGGLVAVNAPTGITAMAVAPDGHRIAVIRGGKLLVAPTGGDQNELQSAGPFRDLPTSLTQLTGVGWSLQDRLVVAGRQSGGQTGFTEVAVDGGIEEGPGGEIGNTTVTQLAAYPDNPTGARDLGVVLYEADNRAYQRSGTISEQISSADVIPGPKSPSPPPADQAPTAPFFLDP